MDEATANLASTAHIVAGPHESWTCSICGGYIRADAKFCKHCKADFRLPVTESTSKMSAGGTLLVLVALLAGWGLGRITSRAIGSVGGVAMGWAVGVTLFWSAFWIIEQWSKDSAIRQAQTWKLFFGVWLFLIMGIALPMTIGAAVEMIWGWIGFPLGFSLVVTMCLVVLPYGLVLIAGRSRSLLREMSLFSDDLLVDKQWRLQVGGWWLKAHLLGILPLALIMWIRAIWGSDVGGIMILVFIAWLHFGSKRVAAWMDQKLHLADPGSTE